VIAVFVIRRHVIYALGILGACGLLAGCISGHDRVSREELPQAWKSALQHVEKKTPDVSGSYQDLGEYTHEYSSNPDHVSRGRLARLLFADIKPVVTAGQVRLTQRLSDRLEIAALRDGQVVASKTVAIEADPVTGAVSLPRESGFDAGGSLAAAGAQSTAIVLFKGSDGSLYLHLKSFTGGVVAVVIPMKTSAENWGRWGPAQ
jgi:hypothetical protein